MIGIRTNIKLSITLSGSMVPSLSKANRCLKASEGTSFALQLRLRPSKKWTELFRAFAASCESALLQAKEVRSFRSKGTPSYIRHVEEELRVH